MKIRMGYVSNSSSSSYWVDSTCFMGIDHHTDGYDTIDFSPSSNLIEFGNHGSWREGDEMVIGFDVDDMKENETKKEFRHRVFEALKSIGYTGKEEDVDWKLPSYSGECGEC